MDTKPTYSVRRIKINGKPNHFGKRGARVGFLGEDAMGSSLTTYRDGGERFKEKLYLKGKRWRAHCIESKRTSQHHIRILGKKVLHQMVTSEKKKKRKGGHN